MTRIAARLDIDERRRRQEVWRYDQRLMKRQPVLGAFGLGLSYGLPAGLLVAILLTVLSEDLDTDLVSKVGIVVAVAVAVLVMRRNKSKPNH